MWSLASVNRLVFTTAYRIFLPFLILAAVSSIHASLIFLFLVDSLHLRTFRQASKHARTRNFSFLHLSLSIVLSGTETDLKKPAQEA